MLNKNPEGYKKLLVFQKAQTLHREILDFVSLFPKTKTFIDLADQISRSMRSTEKNLVEGWKRTTAKEYLNFLSFSIGSNAEMMEDLADIATGLYKELMGIKGIMGEKGVRGAPSTPSSLYTSYSHSTPSYHPFPRNRLDSLKFYPLDETFPTAVKLFLKSKEIGLLLYKLQKSLDIKMDTEHTKPASQKAKDYFERLTKADRETEEYTKSLGLVRLENGQYINKEEWIQKGKPPLFSPTLNQTS